MIPPFEDGKRSARWMLIQVSEASIKSSLSQQRRIFSHLKVASCNRGRAIYNATGWRKKF
jgi:hypothetical protein